MKILLLTDRMDRGGVETHIELLARSLTDEGEEVTLLSSGGEIAKALERDGIRCCEMPPPSHSPKLFLARRRILVRLLKKERFDVLHAHTRLCALLLRTLRARTLRGAVRLVTVHAKFSSTPLVRTLSYWGERTVAVSEDLADHTAKSFRIARGDVRVIPNGIDLSKFRFVERERPQIPSILFASRLETDCSLGASLLLEILPTLLEHAPDLCVTLAGGGNAYEELCKRAKRINRDARREAVRLTGHESDMPSLLSKHHVFVGVSRAAMEAAACGCAVILCGNEGYLGILGKENESEAARTNLCCRASPPPTKEALLADLLSLINSPRRLEEAQREAHRLSRQYGKERMTDGHLSLYRSLSRGMRTVCIGGYFGCLNLGDDLILAGFCAYMQRTHPEVRLIALSGDPRRTEQTHGVRSVSRASPLAILCTLIRSDAFLCGGGSLLQNKTGRLSLFYYLSLLRLSRLVGARPILYAAGFGPITGARALSATRRTLLSCPYISLRDADSMRALLALKIPKEKLHTGADAAFLLPPPSSSRDRQADRVLFVFKGERPSPLLLTVAKELLSHGCDLALLLLDRRMDTRAAASVSVRLSVPVLIPSNERDAFSYLCTASLVISERLHALILALMSKTPAIGYLRGVRDEKIPSLARCAEIPFFFGEDTDPHALTQAALASLEARTESAERLEAFLRDARKKGEKDLEKILELLYNDE